MNLGSDRWSTPAHDDPIVTRDLQLPAELEQRLDRLERIIEQLAAHMGIEIDEPLPAPVRRHRRRSITATHLVPDGQT